MSAEQNIAINSNTTKPDMINSPPHYTGKNGIRVIDVIEDFTAGMLGIEATDTGNCIKYILRWKNKNGIEDLEKCRWYLDHLINHVKKGSDTTHVTGIFDDDIIFDNRSEAEEVLNHLNELVSTFGEASVSDLHDLAGLHCSYTACKYGWRNLINARVIKTRNGYLLKIPKAIPLND